MPSLLLPTFNYSADNLSSKGPTIRFVIICKLLVKPTIADPRGNVISTISGEVCSYPAVLKAQIDGNTVLSCFNISLHIPGEWSNYCAVKGYLSVSLCSNQLFTQSGARKETHPQDALRPRGRACRGPFSWYPLLC